MESTLAVLGLMVCLFLISILSANAVHALVKNHKHPFLQKCLFAVYYFFSMASAPVGLVAMLYSKQQEAVYRKEQAEHNAELRAIMDKARNELEEENKHLKGRIIDEAFTSREEGYRAGYNSGYRSGYREGFENCLDITNFPPEERSSLRSQARYDAEFNLKQHNKYVYSDAPTSEQ